MTDRRELLGGLVSGLLLVGLTASGCVRGDIAPENQFPLVVLAFLLVVVVVFVLCAGALVLVSRRRRRRKLAKILVALVAGAVCGAFWILLLDTAVNPAIPDAMNAPIVLVVGVATALVAAVLLSRVSRLSKILGLSAMAIGFHSLALPIAAIISVLVGGAQAVALHTIALSVGGLLSGLFVVFVADRVLRHDTSRRVP
ncbi:MAG TPA: hypothetical protein VFY90_01225 [Tepidiformaceae bacterium]|nr:hypothetical protein [Tepidiformaceae bacterium]